MNKTKYLLGMVLLACGLYACKKDTPDTPDISVVAVGTNFKVTDSVEFKIEGYADVISFYSGEPGKEYRYKDRLEANDAKLFLNISTQVLFASQKNNLSLWYSTDFAKAYTPAGITAANWTNITSKFTFAPDIGSTTSDVTPSGNIDISDLVVPGKPIFFAFKYVGQASSSAATGGRTWRVPAFNLTSQSPGGTASIADVVGAGWIAVDVKNTANKWTIQTTTPFLYFAPASTTNESEDWAITKEIYPNKVSPDKGLPIKAYTDRVQNYKYKFSKPGTYTVTFVGKNATSGNVKEAVRTLTVIVK